MKRMLARKKLFILCLAVLLALPLLPVRAMAAPLLPAYQGEIVALIKATAIVGYIAVQDLTKMGDIVRGRTYEAFFPLIAVAVIYFILAAILTFLVGKLEIHINPRRRRKEDILKGVTVHD